MRIAVTGATGFLGRYIVHRLAAQGHTCRCWYRPASDRGGFQGIEATMEWTAGELPDRTSAEELVQGCQAVVHSALFRPGTGFRGAEGDVPTFVETNLVGTLHLIEAARRANVKRFVFISTCAVHEKILDDRPLDETHPTWAASHYGAHKAAIEQFVFSYGLGHGFPICGLRPTGIYGVARPVEASKWFELVQTIRRGESVECLRGGKEVHAADVARAAEILMWADSQQIAGQVFNCCDRYISEHEVATIAKQITGSSAKIAGTPTRPKHQIVTDKMRHLGMHFGGRTLLEKTIEQMLEAQAAR